MEYNFKDIEKKWQDKWAADKTFKAENNSGKPKYYVLDMFPYPSGAGLHVGHPLGYIASDIFSRYKRHQGFNVLHPMGYDSFGLPAEQYAIQTGQHPAITTKENIARYREQLDKIGFSFDWDREVKTSDPQYYKWTQWIFIQLFNSWYNPRNNKAEDISTLIHIFETEGFKGLSHDILTGDIEHEVNGFTPAEWKTFDDTRRNNILMNFRLAYLGEAYVNWCPAMGTVLANDEVKDGVSERGGYPVERKLMKQWSMRITAYAQRLLDGLDKIDWTDSLKETQRYWLGRSEGSSLKFSLIPSPSPKEKGANSNAEGNSHKTSNNEKGANSASVESGAKPGWQTADSTIYAALKNFARENRQPQTEAEDKLWNEVRAGKVGYKFRRQHAIGSYIADFVCLSKNLIIEVDGEIHEQTKEQDAARTKVLNDLGFTVIRFSNKQIFEELDTVVASIKAQLEVLPSPLERETEGEAKTIEVFTTRPDTVFGVSFVTLAPEHDLVNEITTDEHRKAVDEYVTMAKNRSERERQADVNKISGVFTGAYVEHPFSGKPIPVWVGDYVLAGYGTGAVMAVPAHDSRDYKFAKHFGLPILKVIEPTREHNFEEASWDEKEGKLANSDFLNGLEMKEGVKRAIAEIEKMGIGKGKVNFRLRDAVFGRQRYWGEPIPVYYKDGIPHIINKLPLVLPEIDKYLPTEDGEPPLARAEKWYWNPEKEEVCGKEEGYPIETTTMPGWAGSSWYYLRYMDAHNDKAFVSKEAVNYWKQVDLYIGGSEHATGHLLYVRFWTMFLKDAGYINFDEPAQKLINQGMIQGTSAYRYAAKGASMDIVSGTKHLNNISIHNPNNSEDLNQINNILKTSCITHNGNVPDRYLDDEKMIFNVYVSSELVKDKQNFFESTFDVNYVDNNVILFAEYYKKVQERSLNIFVCQNGFWMEGKFHPIEHNEAPKDFTTSATVEKMSKSKFNVVTPDLICNRFGADTLRLYEMFLGPLELSKPWNTNGITGVHSFLKKLWRLFVNGDKFEISDAAPTKDELRTLHKTIKKITDDIERFSFNTSVSNFMICVNELSDLKCNKRAVLEPLLTLISPYAPHITEELWKEALGHQESIAFAPFPQFNEEHVKLSSFNYPVSFNGKVRFNVEFDLSLSKEDVEKEVLALEQTAKHMDGKAPKKVIVVPGKIINIVV